MPILVVLFLFSAVSALQSQSNPTPFALSSGSYQLSSWNADTLAGTYPEGMIFHKCKVRDPLLGEAMDSDWSLAYNLTSRSRIVGLDSLGFGFQNTSTPQSDDGAYLGAALLSLNASGRENIHISWIGRTINPAARQYGIILQYRIGETGEFVSLASKYIMSVEVNDEKLIPTIILPEVCNNKQIVQLRWKYYYTGAGESGTRPLMAVDEIFVSSTPITSVGMDKRNVEITFSNNMLTIDNREDQDVNMEIFNLLGYPELNKALPRGLHSFDMSEYATGVYFVIIGRACGKIARHSIVKCE